MKFILATLGRLVMFNFFKELCRRTLHVLIKPKWEGMPFVKVHEGTSTIQFVCPYCDEIDTDSTALNVLLSPPEYFVCKVCGKESRVTAGTGAEGKTAL